MRCAGVLFLVAFSCAALVAAGVSAQAQDDAQRPAFNLVADEVSYDRERDLYEASGHVRVEQEGGRTLTADWLAYNGRTQVGVATGHVRITDRQDVVIADFAAVDLRSLVALAQNAELDTPGPGFQVRGERVQRTGVNTYSIEKGTFTTCRCPPGTEHRPWQLEAGKADVRVGGYATAHDLWLRAFGVPVLYMPWLIYPVKTERQTGFLLPRVGSSSRSGTELETPFFLELGPRAGLLLRPTYFSDRGLKTSAELEYVFGESGEGRIGAAALPGDDEIDSDDPETPFSEDRWAYWLRHQQPLGDGFRLGFDINEISDNEYPLDFDDIEGARNTRFITSSGWAAWSGPGLFGSIQAQIHDDLQSPNDLDRDDFLLQRLPQVDASAPPRRLGGLPLWLGFDSRYTYFHQEEHGERLSFDAVIDDSDPLNPVEVFPARTYSSVRGQFFDTGIDALFDEDERSYRPRALTPDPHGDTLGTRRTEGDGLFEEGELLADDGHRIDLYPHLSLPLRMGVFELLSEVGFRETRYVPRLGDSEGRELWTGRVDLRTRLVRSFALGAQALHHVLEPRAVFVAIDSSNSEENPLFIPAPGIQPRRLSEGDPRLLTRDPSDRVADASMLFAQLGNRIFAQPAVEGGAPRLLAEFRGGASYDFENNDPGRYFAEGRFHPWRALQVHGFGGWDIDRSQLEEATAELQWLPPSRHAFSLGYRYRRELSRSFEEFRRDDDIFDQGNEEADRLSQVDLTSILVVSSRLEVFASGFLSLEDSSSNGGELGFLLISSCRCWDLIFSIEQRTRPDDTRLGLELRLSGLGQRPDLPGDLRNRRTRFISGL